MNRAAKKPCAKPGCPITVARDVRFCLTHTVEHNRAYNKRRGSASSQGYGVAWRRLRTLQLAREPLCRIHRARGETVSAVEVDHIVPKAQGGRDAFENLQSLCKSCHSAKTAREVFGHD